MNWLAFNKAGYFGPWWTVAEFTHRGGAAGKLVRELSVWSRPSGAQRQARSQQATTEDGMRGAEQTLCPGQSFQKCRSDKKQRQGGKVEGAKESFYRRLLEHTCVLPRVIQQRERLVRNKSVS